MYPFTTMPYAQWKPPPIYTHVLTLATATQNTSLPMHTAAETHGQHQYQKWVGRHPILLSTRASDRPANEHEIMGESKKMQSLAKGYAMIGLDLV